MHGPGPDARINPGISAVLMIEYGLEFTPDNAKKSVILETRIGGGEFFQWQHARIFRHVTQFFLTFSVHGFDQGLAGFNSPAWQAPAAWMFGVVSHEIQISVRVRSVKPNAYSFYKVRLHAPPAYRP